MIIKWIIKIFKAINSNKKPNELAAGVAFGLLLALIPGNNLLWIALFILTFFLKINLSMEFVFLAIFKLFIFILDPVLHGVGLFALNFKIFESFYTNLYNTPILPYTEFNNTIVMGGLLTGILLWYPIYKLSHIAILKYRDIILSKIKSSKIYRGIMKIPIIAKISSITKKAYSKYSRLK